MGVVSLRQHTKRRIGIKLWAAGVSLAVGLAMLGGVFFVGNFGNNSNTEQAPKPTSQPTAVHTPVADAIATAPVVTTPEPTPKPVAPKPQPKPAFTAPISIEGDEDCYNDTLAALELIAEKAPGHYAVVTQYIGVIKCVTQGSGMEAYLTPPRYLAGDVTRSGGTMWYAGTIVHDAGHSKLYNDYLTSHPDEEFVPGDIWTGQNAEAACLAVQHDALAEMGADKGTLDYVANVINSGYWNVPYDQRWW